jgi:predicted ABC-type ATPase
VRVDSPDHPYSSRTDDLAARLDQLPVNHPSSPRNPDGSLKLPVPRLKDAGRPLPEKDEVAAAKSASDKADLQSDGPEQEPYDESADPADRTLPYSDAEWAEHVSELKTRLVEAQDKGLATDQQFTFDPDRQRWTRERRQLHRDIAESMYGRAKDVPCEGKAIICGGLGGAGKSTILSSRARNDTAYFTINPDDIKTELARRLMIPEIDGVSTMEASDLVHEESSRIAKRLARRAIADRRNVIWDITMSSRKSTEQRIDQLRSAGYIRLDGIFVNIPVEISVQRADSRHRAGENRRRAGDGPGGRYVPAEIIRQQADHEWGSQNRKTFEETKHRFDSWELYDNSVDGRPAILVDSSSRHGMQVT